MGNRKAFKALLIGALCVIMVLGTVYATPSVVSSTAERNAVAKNWTYLKRGVAENNCMAWAFGDEYNFLWPWYGAPTLKQVDKYMADNGYTAYDRNMSCAIYAYGSSSEVVHFARGLGNGPLAVPISAKWGMWEAFTHSGTDPYYSVSEGGIYGSRVRGYN